MLICCTILYHISLANVDYTPIVGSRVFPANDAEINILVRITSDLIVERNETFKIVLQDPGDNVVIGEHNETVVTIINDDCEYHAMCIV